MNERNLNEGQWEDRKQWSLGVGQRKTFWNRYTCIHTKYAVRRMFWRVHLRNTGHCQTGQCAKSWIDGRLVGTSKIIIEDDSLARDVRSTESGMDKISCRELLRRPSFGTFVHLVRYRVRFSTSVVPQLQLWLFSWCPHSAWATCIYKCLMHYASLSRRCCLSDCNRLASGRCLPENVLLVHGALCVACIFFEYSIITEPCCERRVMSWVHITVSFSSWHVQLLRIVLPV